MGQQWDRVRNQKIPWNKWKRGHNHQNLWDPGKAILTGNIIALQAYLNKEKAQINNLPSHLKELEKEQQTKPKVSTGKEIIKIRAEINEIESKKWCKISMNPRAGSLKR